MSSLSHSTSATHAAANPARAGIKVWHGLCAFTEHEGAGQAFCPPVNAHIVSLHQNAPVRVGQAQGKVRREGLQVPGHINIIPAGTGCTWENDAPACELILQLDDPFLRQVAAEIGLPPDIEIQSRFQMRDARMESLGRAIHDELQSGGIGERLYGDSLAVAIATQLLRLNDAPSPAARRGGLSDAAFRRVLDWMDGSLEKDIGLEDMASVAGVGLSHFKTLFKNSAGVAPYRFLLLRRVERARELLCHTRLPIAEIAFRTGFSDQSHLTRQMRRLLRRTPGDFRR